MGENTGALCPVPVVVMSCGCCELMLLGRQGISRFLCHDAVVYTCLYVGALSQF